MTEQAQTRRRDAAATRESILDAAATLFADRGYDRTTVRDIATAAGANQALLFRYFGSKESLFEAVMVRGGRRQLHDTPPDRLAETVLRAMLATGEQRNHSLAAFLRSIGNVDGGAAVRQELGAAYAGALASLSEEPDARLRADLVLAWIVGIGLLRNVSGQQALAEADPDRVIALVRQAIDTLLPGRP